MAEFDPYHKWLGIPPEEQPPNHYRLLGLTRFESDPDVIESAAEGRMVMLRTRQTGPNAGDSQRLLNEVAAAQRCLLDPNQRAAYDRQLTAQQAGNAMPAVSPAQQPFIPQSGPPQTAPPRSAPPRSVSPEPAPVAAQPVPQTHEEPAPAAVNHGFSAAPLPGVTPHKRRRRSRWFLSPVFIGLLFAGILLLGVIYALTKTGPAESDGEQTAGVVDSSGPANQESGSNAEGDGEKSGSQATDGNTAAGKTGASDSSSTAARHSEGNTNSEGNTSAAGNAGSGAAGTGDAATGSSSGDTTTSPGVWTIVTAERVESSLNDTIEQQEDSSYFVKNENMGARTITLEGLAPADNTRWIRMEALTDDRLPESGPGWNRDGNFVMSTFRLSTIPRGETEWQTLDLKNGRADFSQDRMPPSHTLDEMPQSGWAVYPEIGSNHQLVFELATPVAKGTPVRVEMVFAHRSRGGYTAWLGRFRISFSSAATEPPFVNAAALSGDVTDSAAHADANSTSSNVRMPPPEAAAVDAARRKVREAIPPPMSQAAEELLQWSEELLSAVNGTEDPNDYFAITSEAKRAATMANDARLAFAAIDAAHQRFEVDVINERIATLKAIAKRAQTGEQLDSLLLASEGVALDLMADDQFDAAADLLDEAYQAFQRRDSDWHIDMSSEMRKFARRQVRARELANQAEEKLKSDAADANANATMGMWWAVYQNDFDQGLAFYRKGSDSVWKKLADAESKPQMDAKSLGDQWWNAAQRKDKETQAAMLRRAAHWYEQALPKATATDKKQMSDRLEKIHLLPSFAASKQSDQDIRVGESWDLLPLVQLPDDALDGSWVRRHETIETVTAANAPARFRLPINLKGDYVLAVEMSTPDGGGAQIALPAVDRGYQVVLGVNRMSGLQAIGGLPTPQNRFATPARLTKTQRHSIQIRFSSNGTKGRIDVRLDKRPYLVWEGDLTKLDDPGMVRGAPDGISITALSGARVQIHSARLQLLSGSAKRMRIGQPFRFTPSVD